MKKEKSEVIRENEGKGLAALSKFLLVIALILCIILADRCFLPSGEKWEKLKESYLSYEEPEQDLSDMQIWENIKKLSFDNNGFPIHSGFLLWFWYNLDPLLSGDTDMPPANTEAAPPAHTAAPAKTEKITQPQTAPPAEEQVFFTLDTDIIKENFLGVWQSDERTIIIGKNENYDATDFLDGDYGLMENVYAFDDQAVISTFDISGTYYSVRVYDEFPDTLFLFNETIMFGGDNIDEDYLPEMFTRIDNAKMYDSTGRLNGFLRSLLFIEQGYYEEMVYIDNYACDTLNQRVELVSYKNNEIVFNAEFTNNMDNKTVFIRFVKTWKQNEWITSDWNIITEDEM